LSIDCKATVNIGDYARNGKTRGDNRASDHDMGCEEKYIPWGLVDEDSGQLHIYFGVPSRLMISSPIVCSYWWNGFVHTRKKAHTKTTNESR